MKHDVGLDLAKDRHHALPVSDIAQDKVFRCQQARSIKGELRIVKRGLIAVKQYDAFR